MCLRGPLPGGADRQPVLLQGGLRAGGSQVRQQGVHASKKGWWEVEGGGKGTTVLCSLTGDVPSLTTVPRGLLRSAVQRASAHFGQKDMGKLLRLRWRPGAPLHGRIGRDLGLAHFLKGLGRWLVSLLSSGAVLWPWLPQSSAGDRSTRRSHPTARTPWPDARASIQMPCRWRVEECFLGLL